jgi:transposase
MKIVGCDLHTKQQTIAMVDTETGEFIERTLAHEGNAVREFYAGLEGPVIVGIEATGSMQWFLELLDELGIECRVGHPAKIRAAETRKQKHDRRDARLILDLLTMEGRFPAIWMPSTEQRDLRTLLRDRHQWVKIRSRLQHTLQAIALNHALRQGRGLWTQAGQRALRALPLPPYTSQRRGELLNLYVQLQKRIEELDQQVERQCQQRPQARRLLTHPGVGPVTALATEVFLGDSKSIRRRQPGSQLYRHDSVRAQQREAPTTRKDDQGRQFPTALPVDRSDAACGEEGPGAETLLSAQADSKRNGQGADRSGAQTGDPAMDHDARPD